MTSNSSEAAIFIDGAYLRLVAKEFGKSGRYDLNKLTGIFARNAGVLCSSVFFYTAPPFQSPIPTSDENERKAKYDKFIAKLKRFDTIIIREGRCQKINGIYKQKGVDTLMTMDLTLLPSDYPSLKTIIVVTSDTDFVPVLNHLRAHHGIKVILYYFTDRKRGSKFSMSNHLFTACDERCVILPTHFDEAQLQ